MYFGTFGSIFLITQFVQQVMGYAPFDAGVRMLVWTGATAITSPIAGILAERRGPRALMALGLALQAVALAWLASAVGVDSTNSQLAIPFAIAGIGMGLVLRAVGERAAERRRARSGPGRRPARTTRSARSAASSASP